MTETKLTIAEELYSLKYLVGKLSNTSSTKEKEHILHVSLMKMPELVKWFYAVYDPYTQFNLTSSIAMKQLKKDIPCDVPMDPMPTLKALSKREITGRRAQKRWARIISSMPPDLRPTVNCVLDKDFKCRVGTKILNKALKKCDYAVVPEFNVVLGKPYENQKVWDDKGDWYASRKLDGVRCLAILKRGQAPLLLSRTGKVFTTLNRLVEEFQQSELEGVVLDGELALETPEGQDDFQGLMKQIRRKDHQIENVVYHVFDYISPKGFDKGFSKVTFDKRQDDLEKLLVSCDHNIIKMVPQIRITSEVRFQQMEKRSQRQGWEGLILRKDVPYEGKRTKNLLKVKGMLDLEAEVVNVVLSEMNIVENGKEVEIEVMSAAEIMHKGNLVGVGSGWTLKQRRHFNEHPEDLIGKIITVQYFEETQNKHGDYSLRFPVVKVIHGDKRTT